MHICIDKNTLYPYIQFRNSIFYREYFFYKLSLLKEIETDYIIDSCFLFYKSKPDKRLFPIYNILYRKNKSVTRKFLNLLTNYSLCIWWCDSGRLLKGKKLIISTKYNHQEILLICKYFNNVLKTNVKKYSNKDKTNIHIKDVEVFMKKIAFFIPCKVLISKFLIFYNDSVFIQRWISYLSFVSFYSYNVIYNEYLNKKKI